MVNNLEKNRDTPESYVNYRKFLLHVLPHDNFRASSDLHENLSVVEQYGLWSLAFAKRMEAIYEIVRGNTVFEDELYSFRDQKNSRKKIEQAIRVVQQFVAVISNNLNNLNFDIDQFQTLFIRVYTELGPTVTKWFTKFYKDIIDGFIDPAEYFEAVRQTTVQHGKSTGALFSGGYRRVVELGVEPTQFAAGIDRVSRSVGKTAAKTFTLQAGKVLEKGQTLDQFEADVIERSNILGADINYWVIQASLEIHPDDEYSLESLVADISSLQEKYGHKTSLWFAKGAITILHEQKILDKSIVSDKKNLAEQDFRFSTQEQLTEYIQTFTNLRLSVDSFTFRESFGSLLDEIGPYAAHFYALVRLNGVHVYGFPNLDGAIRQYVQQVGEKFAKKTLWLISKITGNSPAWINKTLEEVIQIREDEGEAAVLGYLRYSCAAARNKPNGVGLLKPKDPNAEVTNENKEWVRHELFDDSEEW